ncbi:hydroxysqualene dehydroxylase HpnE [Caenimonas terrae]|uniref:Hydroxysqualene dehydroxylase HpnE n=1 Tax=Caenimonas terrae TaxID=696074 RepID=A0ABW0ND45_9BURK
MRLAVIGAGWAGLAAAVAATRDGRQVTLFESSRVLGGRARSLPLALPDGSQLVLDNGQHIMIGAYTATLQLMHDIGVDPAQVLLRLPLTLRFPDGDGLALPHWPAPLDAAWGIASARGWSVRDKTSMLAASLRWQLARFRCDPSATVTRLCEGLTPRVMEQLIEPLCVSALNTPAARSSGEVFLRVVRDALFGKGHGFWGGSNLLLPKVDLGRLFPHAAGQWLAGRGARVLTGRRVQQIGPHASGWLVDGEPFDAVLLACPPWEAERLVHAAAIEAGEWLRRAAALTHEAIATVYVTGGPRLPLPMLALHSNESAPAQFAFDRSQLGGPQGLLAFVVSASPRERDILQQQVLAQAAALGWSGLIPVQTVVERRATFASVPGLLRPAMQVGPGLLACGDYVDGPYPATIEGAVRSALLAVASVR